MLSSLVQQLDNCRHFFGCLRGEPGIIRGIFGDWQNSGYWLADKLRMGFAPLPGPLARRKMQLNRLCGLSWLDLDNGQVFQGFFAPLRFAQRVHVPHAFARRWVVDPADQTREKTPGIVEEPFEELLHDVASYMLVLSSIKSLTDDLGVS